MTDRDLRPPQQRAREDKAGNIDTTKWLLIVLGIAALAYGGWWAREHWAALNRSQPSAAPTPLATPAAPAASVAPPAPSLATAESAHIPATPAQPLHPLAPAAQALTANDAPSLDRMAREWLGARALQFLVMPGLAHHVVATIDNLPRGHAAPRLWPLSPVGGKLQTQPSAQGLQIAAANSARYDAVVAFVTSLEPATVVQWYRQAYPVLQQTYEELGYSGQYFNDRLVAVIDHLLQTPQPQEPLDIRLVQVQGQVAPQQPWLRYEFADPDWQARSAGQKILLRLGSAHRAAMMAYLQALRAQIAP
ncbi:DUF3014 domain-containing protein [Comamonas jiangduensis]|uniref:DUF3014 domain-containing protein n=1 Tax=Comamonas jiangduensis TaxID=1194168 RepID=UPI0024E10DE5|nr:DUF3014 domain-containing protein [Comamonas jiangduensis]